MYVLREIAGSLTGTSFQMLSYQIEQREQEHPDDIDEVPVQSGDFDRCVVNPVHRPDFHAVPDYAHNPQTDDHVECVKSGHYVIKHKEHLNVICLRTVVAEV